MGQGFYIQIMGLELYFIYTGNGLHHLLMGFISVNKKPAKEKEKTE